MALVDTDIIIQEFDGWKNPEGATPTWWSNTSPGETEFVVGEFDTWGNPPDMALGCFTHTGSLEIVEA